MVSNIQDNGKIHSTSEIMIRNIKSSCYSWEIIYFPKKNSKRSRGTINDKKNTFSIRHGVKPQRALFHFRGVKSLCKNSLKSALEQL